MATTATPASESPPAGVSPADWAATPTLVQKRVRSLLGLARRSLDYHMPQALQALRMEQYHPARSHFREALAAAEALGDRRAMAGIAGDLSSACLGLAEYAEAADYARQALTLAKALGDQQSEEVGRINLGIAELCLGRIDVAIESLEQARQLASVRASPVELSALINLGLAYSRAGQFNKAIACLEEAQELAERRGDQKRQGLCLINLATIFSNLGERRRAVEQARLAVQATIEPQRRRQGWQALVTLGNCLADQSDEHASITDRPMLLDEALKCFGEARRIAEEGSDREGLLLAELNQAAIRIRQDRRVEAITALEEALALAQKVGDERGAAYCYLNRADARVRAGARIQGTPDDLRQAEADYEQALASFGSLGDDEGLRLAHSRLGALYDLGIGDKSQAEQNYRQAITHWERTRGLLPDENHRITFLGRGLDPYHALASLYIGMGRIAEALAVVEQAKSRTLLEHLRISSIRSAAVTPELIEREARLIAQLRGRRYALRAARGGQRATIADEIGDLERAWDALLSQIEPADPVYVALRRGHPFAWADLQGYLRAADALLGGRRLVLAEYFISGDAVYLFGMRADFARPDLIMLPLDQAELRVFVRSSFGEHNKVRDLIRDNMEERWYHYNYLVEPLARWANPEDIIGLVPHDLLHYLPLHGLRLDGDDLIARNPVFYAPNVSLLSYCQARRRLDSSGAPLRQTAAIFGDSRGNLPAARDEALALGQLFGVAPLLGAAATHEAFRQGVVNCDIVHFAGHADFRGGAESLSSGLLLADSTRLTVQEISDLGELCAQLVTLGGCETGVSESRPGDELIGLTRAFLFAGARALVVSLWRVADDSSAFLMRRFYSYLRARPEQTMADALRQAMLDTRAEPRWSSFYYWAPFMLIGDWR